MGFGVGDLLAGKYRVERIIGRGGMGIVLAARHVDLGELFAVKLVEGVDRSGGERLLREARASARLRGEHIVRLHDVGWLAEKTPFLVLELVRGESVAAELRTRGKLSAEDTALVVLHATLALAEAHASGLVHRDVKPSNLLATTRPDGSRIIKLLDFGIAKLTDGGSDHRITGDSATLGSPAYMSPEQIRDAHAVDARADVWALGVLAHELFTGKPPFTAFTTSGVLASIVADEPAAPPPETPEALRAAITGCLVKSLADRLQTVADVAAVLAPLLPEGAAIAQRVRATLAAVDRRHDAAPAAKSILLPTEDEPTYDPTEISADETRGSSAGTSSEPRPADDATDGRHSRARSATHDAPTRRASPWLIPAVALPLAGALALFASARRAPSAQGDRPSVAAPSTAATTTATLEPTAPPEGRAPVSSAHADVPATTASVVAAVAGGAASAPNVKGRAAAVPSPQPPPPRSARPTPAALPTGDDLDSFGGRK